MLYIIVKGIICPHSLPIDVIESCIRDEDKKPLFTVLETCNHLCDKIVEQLFNLIDMICEEKSLSRFPYGSYYYT